MVAPGVDPGANPRKEKINQVFGWISNSSRAGLATIFRCRVSFAVSERDGDVGDLGEVEFVPNTLFAALEDDFQVPVVLLRTAELDVDTLLVWQRVLSKNIFLPVLSSIRRDVNFNNLIARLVV